MRHGKFEEASVMITEAKAMVMATHEVQRIIPVLTAALELCWLSRQVIPKDDISIAEATLFYEKNNSWQYTELAYWMHKCGVKEITDSLVEFTAPFEVERRGNWKAAAELWKKTDRPYEQALAMFEGDDKHQKEALRILSELGASATHEMLRSRLRHRGVKNIPRGPRQSTRSNPAQLTNRQIDVLNLLKEGMQNAEIAGKLFISAKTVDHHISSILSKLNVNTRTKAVSAARTLGIVS
jgi:DNA-binding CsgD family transcriptional regulator